MATIMAILSGYFYVVLAGHRRDDLPLDHPSSPFCLPFSLLIFKIQALPLAILRTQHPCYGGAFAVLSSELSFYGLQITLFDTTKNSLLVSLK